MLSLQNSMRIESIHLLHFMSNLIGLLHIWIFVSGSGCLCLAVASLSRFYSTWEVLKLQLAELPLLCVCAVA